MLRYESLMDASKLDGKTELGIKIIPDKDSNMLTIMMMASLTLALG